MFAAGSHVLVEAEEGHLSRYDCDWGCDACDCGPLSGTYSLDSLLLLMLASSGDDGMADTPTISTAPSGRTSINATPNGGGITVEASSRAESENRRASDILARFCWPSFAASGSPIRLKTWTLPAASSPSPPWTG